MSVIKRRETLRAPARGRQKGGLLRKHGGPVRRIFCGTADLGAPHIDNINMQFVHIVKPFMQKNFSQKSI